METLFYISALLCVYSYFLYPLLLIAIRPRDVTLRKNSNDYLPKLSLIITAHNEESRIADKIENTLLLEYPRGHLEIIVASDCSTDDTDGIVKTFSKKGVCLVRSNVRKGKEYAQLEAIKKSTGEILVFSDVATQIPQDALKRVASQFNDKTVGALSSEDRFISNTGEIVGEGAYVKYEMWLRRVESLRAGLVGLSGSFFAARRKVCEEWDIESPSDFNTALNCAKAGMVAISSPDVVGNYRDVKNPSLEFNRKVRTVIRGITAVTRHREVLNPKKLGLFAFQVWSHKIMRWGVPWFMALILIINITLLGEGILYNVILIFQLIFYLLSLIGWLLPKTKKITAIRIIYFFIQTNLAIAYATISFLLGKRMTVWTPSKR
jgi:glycosyltransferase involved in cell wall biosynthesis